MAATRGEPSGLAEARRAADHLADVVDRLVAGSMLDRGVLAELAVVVADEAIPAAGVYERLVLLEAAR